MSWNAYLDNLIGNTTDTSGQAQADKACILGFDGAKWTTDEHPNALKLTSQECTQIARTFQFRNFGTFQSLGIHAEGRKYQFLREMDNKTVYGKHKEHGNITLQSSSTAVVIAHGSPSSQQGNINKGVAGIAEYLESLGM